MSTTLAELLEFILRLFKKPPPPNLTLVIPQSDPNEVLVLEAASWLGTKSVGINGGTAVERFQRAVNSHPTRENWCADFVIFCVQEVERKLGIKSTIARTELCTALYDRSPVSMRIAKPQIGCVVVWQHGTSIFGHAGIVEALNPNGTITTIEGNTGPGVGIVREGDGVYRRVRDVHGTPAMHVIGFLKVF